MKAVLACLLLLLAIAPAAAKPECLVIPDHTATNDEGGWTIDRPRRESVWIDNRDVRRYGGKVTLLCDGKRLLVPR